MPQTEFLKAFLRNPRQVGNLIQTSQFATGRMIDPIDFKQAKLIVEFGAGAGNITRRLLKRMRSDAALLCFEVDKKLSNYLEKKYPDPRIKFIADSAEDLEKYIKQYGQSRADYIISALPLSNFSREKRRKILKVISQSLKADGKYIQIQYSLFNLRDLKDFFSSLTFRYELRNIPPAFIYVCQKN